MNYPAWLGKDITQKTIIYIEIGLTVNKRGALKVVFIVQPKRLKLRLNGRDICSNGSHSPAKNCNFNGSDIEDKCTLLVMTIKNSQN